VQALEAAWPAWQIWTVPTWDGRVRRTVWCARRWDWQPGGTVLNAHSAEDLAEYLAEYLAEAQQ
jgi:hypothetical protein